MHENAVFTIGHGVRPALELTNTLQEAGVRTLVDVRRFPSSRRNPQFNQGPLQETLRAAGHFERLRLAIRRRDRALQGAINPNLSDFGERSEANQYSGRRTEAGWKCPFHRKRP